MYRVELKVEFFPTITTTGNGFLMYRVELKVLPYLPSVKLLQILFLMYRVELKESKDLLTYLNLASS